LSKRRDPQHPPGKLVVISAPSGAGKTTLVRKLLEREPDVRFSVSYTTRKPRQSEVPGRDYFFVAEPEFEAMVARGDFLEHAQVFDHWYGTSRAHVESLKARGLTVLLEIDWQGARQVRRAAADAISVFVLPPSAATLERRLRRRASDTEAVIARRLRDAMADMSHWDEFDFVIVNDDLDTAVEALRRVVHGDPGGPRTDDPAMRARVVAILREPEA
jgi:guanylate kinase